MARDSEFQRERKKKQLRQSMVTNDKVRSAPVSWAEDHRRTVNVAGIVVAVLVLAVVLAWFVAERLWRYKTYEVSWRTDVSNASSAGYVSYGDGIVVMNKDGATYYDKKGTKVWSAPYDMSNPKANVKGDYLLIYDLKGKNFAICNKSGITGSGTTSQIITKGVIASTGVTVLQLEDQDASLISYYRNTGEELAVSIRNPLQIDGYPLDISVSPNGQQLAVSYYSISEGVGTSSISFYDFEKGKEAADRIVASFDYSENGAYVPKVVYLSDTKAFAVGDCCISFLTCQTELQLLEKILLLREKFSVFSIITNTLVLLYVMKRKQAISFIFTRQKEMKMLLQSRMNFIQAMHFSREILSCMMRIIARFNHFQEEYVLRESSEILCILSFRATSLRPIIWRQWRSFSRLSCDNIRKT